MVTLVPKHSRADIVREAREWISTRFAHAQHKKGLATDCVGFVGGVAMACGIYPADVSSIPGAAKFLGYARSPDGASFKEACDTFLVPIAIDAAQPGDLLLMRFDEDPQHIAILGDYPGGGLSMIHAYLQSRKVIEHRFAEPWPARVVAAYSFPGVE